MAAAGFASGSTTIRTFRYDQITGALSPTGSVSSVANGPSKVAFVDENHDGLPDIVEYVRLGPNNVIKVYRALSTSTTEVDVQLPLPEQTFTVPGFFPLKMTTETGALKVLYVP